MKSNQADSDTRKLFVEAKLNDLYYKALAADHAFSRELERLFGKEAGDARYDARGKSTPELRELASAYLAAREAHIAASFSSGRGK